MNRTRQGGMRRFSLVKLELPTTDSNPSPSGTYKSFLFIFYIFLLHEFILTQMNRKVLHNHQVQI